MLIILVALFMLIGGATNALGETGSLIPKNFENAPGQIICNQQSPVKVHLRQYTHEKEGWKVRIFGRDGKDTQLTVLRDKSGKPYADRRHFIPVEGSWKEKAALTPEEQRKWLNIADINFSETELQFFIECLRGNRKQAE